jgi:hypothetical protein
LGVTWEVLACIPQTWWTLSTKSLVVRFRMAMASHFQALDILYLLWAKHFKYAKKRSCGVSLRGAYTHNSRHFFTERPITQSILRVSGSMASHSLALDPLYRLSKKNSEKSRENTSSITHMSSDCRRAVFQ